MFGYDGGRDDNFHLLQHRGRMLEGPQFAAAIGTAVERVRNHLIKGFGRKVGPQMLLMAGLHAPHWRRWPSFRGGFGGLTRSLEGGLEEFKEFFFAFASSASNAAIRSHSGAVAFATAASIIASTSLRVKTSAMPP